MRPKIIPWECVKNEIIQTSANVKYLGVYLDRNLTYQNEV